MALFIFNVEVLVLFLANWAVINSKGNLMNKD